MVELLLSRRAQVRLPHQRQRLQSHHQLKLLLLQRRSDRAQLSIRRGFMNNESERSGPVGFQVRDFNGVLEARVNLRGDVFDRDSTVPIGRASLIFLFHFKFPSLSLPLYFKRLDFRLRVFSR